MYFLRKLAGINNNALPETSVELLCPAGNMPALKAAIDHGADAVYIGMRDGTNARHFAGLNIGDAKLSEASAYVHNRGKKLHVAINTYAHPDNFDTWKSSVDKAVDAGADALIVADIGVMEYAANQYPHIDLHVSVQASATNTAAIKFYTRQFSAKRVVLPRVLSIQQVQALAQASDTPLEVFAFGSLCIMSEGRCYLSSYLTGESPNTVGACSPAKYVRWEEKGSKTEARLNNILIDCFEENEPAGYPTLCKGRFDLDGHVSHALESPTSLNTLHLLPELAAMGVASVKIEGRQRSPSYVAQVTSIWRRAIDMLHKCPEAFEVNNEWMSALAKLSEGSQTTLGAYDREWR